MADRELTMEDYLAMAKRRLRVVLIPALVAPLGGFLASRILPPRYTTQTTVLVEGQKVPENYVMPVITSDFTQRVQTLSQEVVSRSKLIPVLQGLGVKPEEQNGFDQGDPAESGRGAGDYHDERGGGGVSWRQSQEGHCQQRTAAWVQCHLYGRECGARAKDLRCHDLADVNENLRSRSEAATSTTNFLDSQLKDAKQAVDDQDAQAGGFQEAIPGPVADGHR